MPSATDLPPMVATRTADAPCLHAFSFDELSIDFLPSRLCQPRMLMNRAIQVIVNVGRWCSHCRLDMPICWPTIFTIECSIYLVRRMAPIRWLKTRRSWGALTVDHSCVVSGVKPTTLNAFSCRITYTHVFSGKQHANARLRGPIRLNENDTFQEDILCTWIPLRNWRKGNGQK